MGDEKPDLRTAGFFQAADHLVGLPDVFFRQWNARVAGNAGPAGGPHHPQDQGVVAFPSGEAVVIVRQAVDREVQLPDALFFEKRHQFGASGLVPHLHAVALQEIRHGTAPAAQRAERVPKVRMFHGAAEGEGRLKRRALFFKFLKPALRQADRALPAGAFHASVPGQQAVAAVIPAGDA